MTDPRPRRHDAKILERLLPPAQELIALEVALVFQVCVDEHRRVGAVLVHLHRMIDHQVNRLERIDARRVPAELRERVAHRGEIHHAWHAGEILEQHARRAEGDLLVHPCAHVPRRHREHVLRLHEGAVLVPEEILEEDLQREREGRDRVAGNGLQRVEAIDHV